MNEAINQMKRKMAGLITNSECTKKINRLLVVATTIAKKMKQQTYLSHLTMVQLN